MKEPRKVRGLMGAAEAEAKGEQWVMEEPYPDFVPGMGLGATKQATRWAWMGYNLEKRLRIEQLVKQKRGRPAKGPFQSKDAFRAYNCWAIAQNLDADKRKRITNRALIAIAIKIEKNLKVPVSERAFPDAGAYEQSVSRGKKALKIDASWNSKVCEKIAKN